MTVEESICRYAQAAPDKIAVECEGSRVSYSELWHRIKQRASELVENGLKPHRPYVFRATQDAGFVVTYCAVHYAGAIAVPLESKASDESFESVKAEVESCDYPEDVADILYTTGTTGKSKGVMITKACLVASADNFISSMPFTPDLLFIISGPLNHIASLFKMHPTLTSGGTVCVLDGLRDINAFFKVFELPYPKFATFLVPASIRLLLQFSCDRLSALADKVSFIETGAAPITRRDMELLSKALPHSRLYNTLGGTEIGSVCTYDFNDGKYMEGCIGRPFKNSKVEFTPEGGIVVSGPVIMKGYVADAEATNRVLKDGKVYTSDMGFMDEDGLIHLKGRQGDVINVGGYKVDPVEVESAVSSYKDVKDCICIADTHPVIGTVLKILVVLEEGVPLDKQVLALYLKSKLDAYKLPTYYEAVDSIKRTYNGKLDRKYYKK